MSFLIGVLGRLLSFALAVFLVSKCLPGIRVRNFGTAFAVAFVYAIFYYFAYHVFFIFSQPFGWLTLGLGFWIINTILLLLTDKVVKGFEVSGLLSAALASAAITLLNGFFLRMMAMYPV